MTAINILQRGIYPVRQRVYTGTSRPNLINHLIIRMGLGLFMAVLPLLFYLFMMGWVKGLQTGTLALDWQVLWAGHISWAFIMAMFSSFRIAVIIRLVSLKSAWLKQYGRTAGRICTISATGLSVIVPYTVFRMANTPAFLLACIIPVMTFIVIRSATKDYLLRVRIWFDHADNRKF